MTVSLVVTFVGRDRPGLVNALAEAVAAAGGNWLESRLARLAGEFAGIVLVGVPGPNVATFTALAQELEKYGLRVSVEPSLPTETRPDATIFELALIGHDRPGIVRDATAALLKFAVSIEEFSSRIESAAFTGETMFRVTARLAVPAGTAIADMREALERLAGEIMVDLTVGETHQEA